MINDQTVIRVGISDLKTASGSELIRTSGLGSCVGAVIYDLSSELAGLAHVMLPDSSLTRQEHINEYKYADTALPILIKKLCARGARKHALKAKIAGGAQMFQFSQGSGVIRIGPRNIEAVKSKLRKNRIPIVAKAVGGNNGRTIEFNPITGKLMVRTINKSETHI